MTYFNLADLVNTIKQQSTPAYQSTIDIVSGKFPFPYKVPSEILHRNKLRDTTFTLF